jgi:hypothetical protein
MNNTLLRNKNLYKIFLSCVKFLPITLAIIQIIILIFNYFGIIIPVLTYFGGFSILFLILLYLIAEVFQFCYLYKIPLWYLSVIFAFSVLRNAGYLPIPVINLYRLYTFISGLFIVLFIYFKYKNRHKPKVDHGLVFCTNYCGC